MGRGKVDDENAPRCSRCSRRLRTAYVCPVDVDCPYKHGVVHIPAGSLVGQVCRNVVATACTEYTSVSEFKRFQG